MSDFEELAIHEQIHHGRLLNNGNLGGKVVSVTEFQGHLVVLKEVPILSDDSYSEHTVARLIRQATGGDPEEYRLLVPFAYWIGQSAYYKKGIKSIYMLEPYYQGVQLKKISTQTLATFSHEHAVQIFDHIFTAATFLRSLGLMHMDVEANNILIGVDGACLCDLGQVEYMRNPQGATYGVDIDQLFRLARKLGSALRGLSQSTYAESLYQEITHYLETCEQSRNFGEVSRYYAAMRAII